MDALFVGAGAKLAYLNTGRLSAAMGMIYGDTKTGLAGETATQPAAQTTIDQDYLVLSLDLPSTSKKATKGLAYLTPRHLIFPSSDMDRRGRRLIKLVKRLPWCAGELSQFRRDFYHHLRCKEHLDASATSGLTTTTPSRSLT